MLKTKLNAIISRIQRPLPLQLKERVAQFTRRDDIAVLLAPSGIGVELGVAEGMFSEKILRRSQLSHLYSIDMWAGDRGHDVNEYKRAVSRLDKYRDRSSVLRMTFDEALDLFPENYFDFIYVDGYAHTGEEGGKTFYDWYPKLKSGGVFGGDDYDPVTWPLVKQSVDQFIAAHKLDLHIINDTQHGDVWSNYPTWFAIKP